MHTQKINRKLNSQYVHKNMGIAELFRVGIARLTGYGQVAEGEAGDGLVVKEGGLTEHCSQTHEVS